MNNRNPVIDIIQQVNGPDFTETILEGSGKNRITEGLIWITILGVISAIIFYFVGMNKVSEVLYMVIIPFVIMNLNKIGFGIMMLREARLARKASKIPLAR